MRPEKRPQTIMEQYRYREMMREEHNMKVLKAQLYAHMTLAELEGKWEKSSLRDYWPVSP
jgi:hypothetical protein